MNYRELALQAAKHDRPRIEWEVPEVWADVSDNETDPNEIRYGVLDTILYGLLETDSNVRTAYELCEFFDSKTEGIDPFYSGVIAIIAEEIDFYAERIGVEFDGGER